MRLFFLNEAFLGPPGFAGININEQSGEESSVRNTGRFSAGRCDGIMCSGTEEVDTTGCRTNNYQ